MAELLDSGARREFGNGAVRDVAEGKGRCDLLPLGIVSKLITEYSGRDGKFDRVLNAINEYVRHGTILALYAAMGWFAEENEVDKPTLILEVAKQYEDGARKYNDRNWEKGIPVHVFIDSGVRHYLKYLRGDKDEPHDRAFIWNMLGAIWTHENKPELIDLPFADKPATDAPHRPTQAEYEEMFVEDKPEADKYANVSDRELAERCCNLDNYCHVREWGTRKRPCPLYDNGVCLMDGVDLKAKRGEHIAYLESEIKAHDKKEE